MYIGFASLQKWIYFLRLIDFLVAGGAAAGTDAAFLRPLLAGED